jgi:hypothetical protein
MNEDGCKKDVCEYLAAVPLRERAVHKELRRTIKAASPMAEERLSYAMPGFMYHGSPSSLPRSKPTPGFKVGTSKSWTGSKTN